MARSRLTPELRKRIAEADRLASAVNAPRILVELGFDSTPAPPTTVAERLAKSMSQLPTELASRPADAPSVGAAGAQVPLRAPRTPREPISRLAWRSQASRRGEGLSRGVRDADF